MGKRLTTEEFISKAREVHGDRYDYSKVEYKNAKTKVKIICPIHGVFEQSPDAHLHGQGCQDCGYDSNKLNQESFIEKAKEKCTNKSFNYCHCEDNTCVFCLSHIKTGHIIYIGKYDFEISLGLDFKQRFGPSYNFLFNKESYKNEE